MNYLDKMTVPALREIAARMEIKHTTKTRKADLIEAIGARIDVDHVNAFAENDERDVFAQNRAWIARHDLRSGRKVHVDAAISLDHAEALIENAIPVSRFIGGSARIDNYRQQNGSARLTPRQIRRIIHKENRARKGWVLA